MGRYRRFSDISVSEKLLDTCFLLILSMSYILAIIYLYVAHVGLDNKPGLSMEDIVWTYYGNRSGTAIESSLDGSMRVMHSPDERKLIISWIHRGANEKEYHKQIKPIFEKKCISCHRTDSDSVMDILPLTSYKEVMETVKMDPGMSIGSLVKVSHIHLFGIAFLFFLVGKIFILSEINKWLKRIAVVIPFVAIVLDIGSWWVTRTYPVFAYTVVIGGVLMGLSFGFQVVVSLYQMWLWKPKDISENEGK